MNSIKILQWNCRGYRHNYGDLIKLIHMHQPRCICIQESLLGNFTMGPPRHYKILTLNPGNVPYPGNGLVTLIHQDCVMIPLTLDTQLQALAVRVRILNMLITICNIYIHPNSPLSLQEIQNLIRQLPQPYLLLGDFNARHPTWGGQIVNQRGRIIEQLLMTTNNCILNTGRTTHFHVQTGTSTAIDLSLCSPDLAELFSWSVEQDLHGSDHHPILLEHTAGEPVTRPIKPILKRADWSTFQALTAMDPSPEGEDVEQQVSHFMRALAIATSVAIPHSKGTARKNCVPWWNDACSRAALARKQALRRYQRTRAVADKISYNRAKALATYTQNQARKVSWRKYVSALTLDTPMTKIWKRIAKMNGKYDGPSKSHLMCNGVEVTDEMGIATALADSFQHISSGVLAPPTFLATKQRKEREPLHLNQDEEEMPYNEPITLIELHSALTHSRNTSPGPDGITYAALKHLHPTAYSYLLNIFNTIWLHDVYPNRWRTSTVFAFPKPGKTTTDTANYRPIALTTCVGKLLERIVHTRLMQHLESNNLISQIQFGFRKNHSTTDSLLRLRNFVQENKRQRRYSAAIFFDLKKAYDTIWKHGLLKDLNQYNIKGHMAKYIYNFLQNRTFRVKVGSSFSPLREQVEGVPQGSVLSCSLFLLAINSIALVIPPGTNGSLFVDDILIYASSSRQALLERRLQAAVSRIETWATDHGLQFAPTKTIGIYFRVPHQEVQPPSITLYNEPITFDDQVKFLGMIIDSKLSWNNHISQLKVDCLKRMHLLKCLSHKTWGADRDTLMRVYRAVIRAKLDYGSIIYQTAGENTINKLNPVHNAALRLSTGAFRSSPVVSLYAESGEQPLRLRRKQLSLQYAARIMQSPQSLAWSCVHRIDEATGLQTLYIPTSDNELANLQLPIMRVMQIQRRNIPSWRIPITIFCNGWNHRNKSIEHSDVLRGQFLEHREEKHSGSQYLFTDGSKIGDAVGYAVVSEAETFAAHRLIGETSIYTAELMALAQACELVCDRAETRFTIFSDSKSALESLHRVDTYDPIIHRIFIAILRSIDDGKTIKLCWVPGHTNVKGNEKADEEARSVAISQAPVHFHHAPARDYYPHIKRAIKEWWQHDWESIQGNKLRQIKNSVRSWNYAGCPDRLSEVILCRLRIGHTRLTHRHLMEQRPPPYCDDCLVPLTVIHILVECPNYTNIRNRLFPTVRGINIAQDLTTMLAEKPGLPFGIRRLMRYVTECDLLRKL